MPTLSEKFIKPLKSRLSRRIVFWVFVSVIVIEAIILIPSYLRREQELLRHLKTVSSAKVDVIMSSMQPEASDNEILRQVKSLRNHPRILGGVLYSSQGEKIGMFGESPELSFPAVNGSGKANLKSANGTRYDSVWTPRDLHRNYVLILRQDSSDVRAELYAFILRIAGLVVIISVFVTMGAGFALHPIVVTPILRLRGDLIKAGDAISQDRETPAFYSASIQRGDELGEVITAFNQMYRQISEAVSERKKAEAALQKSFKQVEAYSNALNDELVRGRKMQMNFLPAELLRKPGWEFAAFFMPARQVAGDFYDVFDLSGGNVGIVIADVCDKGVGAALFMALFRSLIRIFSGQTTLEGLKCTITGTFSEIERSDPEVFEENRRHFDALKAIQLTNDYIAQNHEELGMFATVFFGVLDLSNGTLTYINGGHDSLYVVHPSGGVKEVCGPTGPAVGFQYGVKFKVRQTRLNPGEILLGYTDGVTEARSTDDTFFSEKRLLSSLESPAPSANALLDQIAREVKKHVGDAEQFDDITMVAIRRGV